MIKFFRHIRKSLIQKNQMGKYFKYAIGEIILVVIGILIALQINNWNEAKKINNAVTTGIKLITQEIQTNKSLISDVRDYHISVRDTLGKIEAPNSEKEVQKTFSFWQGMQTPRLQESAFQTTIQSGVAKDFKPELLQELNNLYTYQESYNEYTNSASQIFFNIDFSDINNFKRIVSSVYMTMQDLYYFENELMKRFDYTIQKINSFKD